MYVPRIEFCEICGAFEVVKRISGHNICINCIEQGKTLEGKKIEQLQKEEKARREIEEKIIKQKEAKRIYDANRPKQKRVYKPRPKREKGIRVKKPKEKVYADTTRRLVRAFFEKNPTATYTTVQLWEMKELSYKANNYNSFSNALRDMDNRGELCGRSVYINGRKSHKIYSLSKDSVEELDERESVKAIEKIIYGNLIVDTRFIYEKLNCSDRNISKVIKARLLNKVAIWKKANKYYYTGVNNDEQIKTLREKVEGIVRVF
jgi:hypothetical protein